jgi:hypothetical protein
VEQQKRMSGNQPNLDGGAKKDQPGKASNSPTNSNGKPTSTPLNSSSGGIGGSKTTGGNVNGSPNPGTKNIAYDELLL